MSRLFYQVAPRYTPGSPAMVNEGTALRVAEQEKVAYEHAKTGFYGEEDKTKAETLGLAGIVERVRETAKGWRVYDVLTEEKWLRPFRADCLKCKAKKLNVQRGKLEKHSWPGSIRIDCPNSGASVAKKLEAWEEI